MTDRAMTDTRRVSDTDHGVLVFSPPAKGGKLSEPAEELEDQLSICLAKFAPRAKLVYGAVPCGKAKTYPVEVVIPAAKNASEVTLVVQAQYQRGKEPPIISCATAGTDIVDGTVTLPESQDRVVLLVSYRPHLEDSNGVLGSISMSCAVGGMTLKGELAVTAKSVMDGRATDTRSSAASVKSGFGPVRGKAPLPPTQAARHAPGSMGPPPPRPPTAHRGSTAAATASNSTVTGARVSASSQPPLPTPSSAGSTVGAPDADTKDADVPPSTPIMLARFIAADHDTHTDAVMAESPVYTSAAPTAAPSAIEDDTDTSRSVVGRDQRGAGAASARGGAAGARPSAPAPGRHTSGMPLKRSLSLVGSNAGGAAGAAPAPAPTSARSGSVFRAPQSSARPAQTPGAAARAGSVAGGVTPRHTGTASSVRSVAGFSMHGGAPGSACKGGTPGRAPPPALSPGVAVKTARSYLQVHTEAPLLKQERALTAWLNSHLAPPQSVAHEEGGDSTSGGMQMQRLAAQTQGLLWRLYKKDPQVFDCLKIVYAKIDAGILSFTDVPLVSDVRGLQQLVEPLLSYHPFWLRAGLVTVLRGDLAGPARGPADQGLQSAVRKGLAVLIREGLLLEREVNGAADKHASWIEYRGLVLRNFLLLVLLLDRAVTQPDLKLPQGLPPLFHLKSTHKSSAEVVRAFLNGRLSGLGDAVHHLERWGYTLRAVCAPVDEYDWKVRSLREDLRTGIRLAKLYEQLTGFNTLLSGHPPLRLHPSCTQQSLDNMHRVVERFQTLGVLPPTGQRVLTHAGPLPFRARDLVEASREVTLSTLFTIAIKWELPRLVTRQALATEAKRLLRVAATKLRRPPPVALSVFPERPLVSALLSWAQAACAPHSLRLENFTSAFGDGRAICYILHAYLPDEVPFSAIYQPAAPKPEDVAVLIEGDEDVDMDTLRNKGWCAVYEAGGYIDDQGMLRSYKEGVRRNFQLIHNTAATLGKVPVMLSADDFLDGGFEERCVILYVAHLASRLLELSVEKRACHVIVTALRQCVWERKYGPEKRNNAATTIQKYYRRHMARKQVARIRAWNEEQAAEAQLAQRHAAASLIQSRWREHKAQLLVIQRICAMAITRRSQLVSQRQQSNAAVVMQSAWGARRACRQYSAARGAAVCVQAAWRAKAVRRCMAGWAQAATRVQAAWRGYSTRKALFVQKHAAVRIQAAWRGFRARKAVCVQRQAAVRIQSAWRGHIVRRMLATHTHAAVRIQTAWRGHVVRQMLAMQRQAAVRIQSAWRGHVVRQMLATQQQAAVRIQSAWRRHAAKRMFATHKQAAVRIQSAWRGHTVRQMLATQKQAAVCIQSALRAHIARRLLATHRQAAVRIQAAWRGHVARQSYATHRQAAVRIQSAWRGHAARRVLGTHKRAAVRVQSAWRGYVARQSYATHRQAAVRIQSAWRGHAARNVLATQKQAAVRIQSAWRGHVARLSYATHRQAAVRIQSAWRGHAARRVLATHKRAAVCIQTAWRGYVARQILATHRRAAVRMQSAWRGCVARQMLATHRLAAVRIQSAWRMHHARSSFVALRHAVLVCQRRWRGSKVRRSQESLRAAATTLQAHWRAWQARQSLQQAQQAATLLQSAWRARVARIEHREKRDAAVVMQSAARAWAARRAYTAASRAAEVLQSAWRARVTALQYQSERRAAVVVQRDWRAWSCRSQYASTRAAAITLQSACRARCVYHSYQRMRRAAVCIQAHWRGYQARARYQAMCGAARVLQSAWRARAGAHAHTAGVAAATALQAAWRARVVRGGFCQQREAVLRIQAAWRGARLRRSLHAQQWRDAAVCMQTAWRARAARRDLAACIASAVSIQAAWRAACARRAYTAQQQAAVTLQTLWRARAARSDLVSQRLAAIAIQSAWRARVARTSYQAQRAAAVVIQTAWRGYAVRRDVSALREAATCMQTRWRAHKAEADYTQLRGAALAVQTAWRCHAAAGAFRELRGATTCLQAAVRAWRTRNLAEERRGAIVCMQNMWRRQKAMRAACELRKRNARAATVLQASVRGWLARRLAQRRRKQIIIVQGVVRGFLTRRRIAESRAVEELNLVVKQYAIRLSAARLIQAWWRGHAVRLQTEPILAAARQRRREARAAVVIQRAYRAHLEREAERRRTAALAVLTARVPLFRRWLARVRARHAAADRERAAVVVQSYWRMCQTRRQTRQIIRRITKVQALWRGYRVRLSDGKAKAEARRKLQLAAEASARNPHRTLGARVRDALEQLLSKKDPAQLSLAIAAMETGTRYSLACCELIAFEEGAAALLRLARSLNRSKPHVDLLIAILAVLSNICRHEHLVPYVLSAPDSIVILSERLQFFRDSEEVFMPAVTLTARLLTAPDAPVRVARTPGVLKQWEGIAQILIRRIEMERKYICRLEGQKGSDVSAKEATRKLLMAGKQLEALQAIITQVDSAAEANGIQVEHHNAVPHHTASTAPQAPSLDLLRAGGVPETVVPVAPAAARTWQPKNTLVRGVLREVKQTSAAHQAAAASQAAAAAAIASQAAVVAKVTQSMVQDVAAAAAAPPPPPPSQPGSSHGCRSSHHNNGGGSSGSQTSAAAAATGASVAVVSRTTQAAGRVGATPARGVAPGALAAGAQAPAASPASTRAGGSRGNSSDGSVFSPAGMVRTSASGAGGPAAATKAGSGGVSRTKTSTASGAAQK